MGSRGRDSAGCIDDPMAGSGRPRPAHEGLRRLALLLVLTLGAALASGASALAAGEPTHVFSAGKSFIAEGACKLTEPGGVAVRDATGEIFVFDRANNSINRFSSTGQCLTHRKIGIVGSVGEETNEGIAVDNAPSSPSFGDVYLVDAEVKAILKFKPEAEVLKLEAKIKKFKRKENGEVVEEFEEFEEIHGLGVDSEGSLWVDEGETFLDRFSGAVAGEPVSRELLSRVEVAGGSCAPRPGFALTGDAKTFYIGRERENRKEECQEPTALMKLTGAGEPAVEPPYNAQLDLEPSAGAAVNRETGEVYFDNKTSISAFGAGEDFAERFGHASSEGELQESTGVAVNAKTDEVLAVDAHEGRVVVFVASTPSEGSHGEATHGLPDNRAYEQVSPQNKFGASIYGIGLVTGMVEASEDGGAIAYTASGPVVSAPPTNRAIEPSQNVARRGAQSWGTEAIGTPHGPVPNGYAAGSGTEYEFFTPDLSAALVTPWIHGLGTTTESLLSPEATEAISYWRTLTASSASCEPVPSSCYTALVSPLNFKGSGPFGRKVTFATATPDGHHAIVNSAVALTSDPIGTQGVYEWQSGGALQLISVLPAGETGPPEFAKLGGTGQGAGGMLRHAISNDGSRVFWSTGSAAEGSALYLRDTAKGETLRLDKAQGGAPEPEVPSAQFQSASADGSKVFFTDTVPLLPDSTSVTGFEEEENGSLGSGDLYVCEIVETAGKLACNLTDLTAKGEGSSEAAAVQGVIGASEDGSYVYFVADGVFGSKAGPGRCTPREETEVIKELQKELPVRRCNLYVAHRGAGSWETPTLVAGLTSEDQSDWLPVVEKGELTHVASRVSTNGEYLAFMSSSSLTGYDNRATNAEAENARAQEVFLYGAASGLVSCASCNPTGARPNAVRDRLLTHKNGAAVFTGKALLVDQAENWLGRWLAADIPGWTGRSPETAIYQSRYLSETGRLFFNSADSLVAADTSPTMDVYQFESSGEGSCASATGCIALMSAGTSPQESAFLDASSTGSDVFLLTSAQLVKQDIDSGYDIYDARVCTAGSPCLGPPAEPPAPCADEGKCKGASAEAPAPPPAPPTAAISGPGNSGTVQILGEKEAVKPTPTGPTRAQKLKAALKKCKKIKKHAKRVTCEKQARKKYGPIKGGKASARSRRHR